MGQSDGLSRDEALLLRAARHSDPSSFEIWRAVSRAAHATMPESPLLPAPRSLTMHGLIVGYRDEETKPVRRRYRVTGAGLSALASAVGADAASLAAAPDGHPVQAPALPDEADPAIDALVKAYSAAVASVLRVTPRLEAEIRYEIEDHLTDAADAIPPAQASREEAVRRAIESLGEPLVLGRAIAAPIHAPGRQAAALGRALLAIPFGAVVGSLAAAIVVVLLAGATDLLVGLLGAAAQAHVAHFRRSDAVALSLALVLAGGAFAGTASAVTEFQRRSLCSRSAALTAFVLGLGACMLVVALFAPVAVRLPASLALLVLPAMPIAGAASALARRADPGASILVSWRRPGRFYPWMSPAFVFGGAWRRAALVFVAATLVAALLPGVTFAAAPETSLPGAPAAANRDGVARLDLGRGDVHVRLLDPFLSSVECGVWRVSMQGYSATIDAGAEPVATFTPTLDEMSSDTYVADISGAVDREQGWYWVACSASDPAGRRETVAQGLMSVVPVTLERLVDLIDWP